MSGPYETEREAIAAVRHILDSPPPAWQDGSQRLLESACLAAGVKLGAYDHRILVWLTRFQPQICAVIAGLITRASATVPPAYAAPVHDAFHDALQWRQAQLAEPCTDCDEAKDDPEQRELYSGRCERHAEIADAIGLLRHTARDLSVGVTL